jgi:carboxylesterase type B
MAMPAAKGLFHRVLTMSGQQVTAKPTVIATEVTKDVLDKLVEKDPRGAERLFAAGAHYRQPGT